MRRRIVLLATERYSINALDLYMFFRRSDHEIAALLYHDACATHPWWRGEWPSDPSRDDILEDVDFRETIGLPWSTVDELLRLLHGLDFDYVAMGNGTDAHQQPVIEAVGPERCLFSEYGWLPWSGNFYLTRLGCSVYSDLAELGEDDLRGRRSDPDVLESLRRSFDHGRRVFGRDFVYMPLQKDVDDFKFTLCDFRSNEEFIECAHEVVPREMKVLVRCHPLFQRDYRLERFGRGRFRDVTGRPLNKFQLYRRMAAMLCINSTSILEALLFGGTVFAYGKDLYLNKGLVHFDVRTPEEFRARLAEPPPRELCDGFTSLLLERQVDRRSCVEDGEGYVRNHYWNTAL